MKTVTITKTSSKAGRFDFAVNWPDSPQETVDLWTLDAVANQAQNAAMIAARAKAEGLVLAHFRKHGKTQTVEKDGKSVTEPLPASEQTKAVREAAYAEAQTAMADWTLPLGERVRLSPMERAEKVTSDLSDAQLLELMRKRGMTA